MSSAMGTFLKSERLTDSQSARSVLLSAQNAAVTESLADVTYWILTVLTARSYPFKGTQRNSSSYLSDPDRTQFSIDFFSSVASP